MCAPSRSREEGTEAAGRGDDRTSRTWHGRIACVRCVVPVALTWVGRYFLGTPTPIAIEPNLPRENPWSLERKGFVQNEGSSTEMARAVVQKAIHNQNELDDLMSMLISAVRGPREPPPFISRGGRRIKLTSVAVPQATPCAYGFGHWLMVLLTG